MVMSWIWLIFLVISLVGAAVSGRGSELAASIPQGSQAGITLALSIGGSLCLWSGVGKVMELGGLTEKLSKFMRPLLIRLFPSSAKDSVLAGSLSANVCANLLGLGNAATPMGVQAAKRLAVGTGNKANGELCRLIVLNTASIQLIPATVAAVRSGLGCASPFDILPAVWVTSLCSASAGIFCAWLLERVWRK